MESLYLSDLYVWYEAWHYGSQTQIRQDSISLFNLTVKKTFLARFRAK